MANDFGMKSKEMGYDKCVFETIGRKFINCNWSFGFLIGWKEVGQVLKQR
jgi:hypothetical protein